MRLLFTFQPLLGHWHPMVPLAQALEASGHQVAFATTEGFRAQVEAKGFSTFRAGVDETEGEVQGRKVVRATHSVGAHADYMQSDVFAGIRAEQCIPDVLDIIREWQPAVVVRENTEYSGCVAAERAGIPHAVLQITAPRTTFLEVIDKPVRRLCRLVGLPEGNPADMLYRYLMLSSRPPSLWNPDYPVPPTMYTFRYAGFSQSGEEELPGWTEELGERPTVYATLGTVANYRTDIISAILEGLRGEPVNLVMAIGRGRDPLEFGEQPPNVHIERYVPQTLLMPLCDLVVTHGGSGTMMDALSLGLPMVVIPIGADQPDNAERCERAGVARVVTPPRSAEAGPALAHAIRDAVREVLALGHYRDNARRVQRELETLPGLDYPVALLESLAEGRRPLRVV